MPETGASLRYTLKVKLLANSLIRKRASADFKINRVFFPSLGKVYMATGLGKPAKATEKWRKHRMQLSAK